MPEKLENFSVVRNVKFLLENMSVMSSRINPVSFTVCECIRGCAITHLKRHHQCWMAYTYIWGPKIKKKKQSGYKILRKNSRFLTLKWQIWENIEPTVPKTPLMVSILQTMRIECFNNLLDCVLMYHKSSRYQLCCSTSHTGCYLIQISVFSHE